MPRDDCLKHILSIVCNVFDAHTCALFLRQAGGQYVLSEHFSLSDNIASETVISPGMGVAGWIIRNKQPLLINQYDQAKSVLGYYRKKGEESMIKAFMGCPLDDSMGVLCLDSKRTYSFSSKDQKILSQFARLINFIHTRSSLMAQDQAKRDLYTALQILLNLRQRFPRWSVFLTNFLTVLAGASGFGHGVLAVRNENGTAYFLDGASSKDFERLVSKGDSFPIGAGLAGWVFKNESPIYSLEPSETTPSPFGGNVSLPAFKSIVCLPVIVHKKTRGVLVLANEQPVEGGLDSKEFMHTAADYLSLFLETLYLRNKLAQERAAVRSKDADHQAG